MRRQKQEVKSKRIWAIVAIGIIIGAGALGLKVFLKSDSKPPPSNASKKILVPIKPRPVIDYNQLEEDNALQELMQKRKAKYGLDKGVDIITKTDETLKIGNTMVSVQEIMEKIRLQSGDIVEKDIKFGDAGSAETVKELGIYVVQPGDNIWNIHFKFLKDYFDNKGVTLSPLADEPEKDGKSSGVGRILKFSENTVQIYNLKEQTLDIDLNVIIPLSKIVVYNMDQIFKLLDLIDYQQVYRIQFDGETLWIPAE